MSAPTTPGSLNGARRARDLNDLPHETVDVLVVGLGATGAGVALDAASRGLSVAAIDAHDLAFGTSRWSSKLIHGGLRYLVAGQVAIAHESAVERDTLMRRTAPHLIRALPFVMPLTPALSGPKAAAALAGLFAGDMLRRAARTPRTVLPSPRRMSAMETLRMAPALRSYDLRGGLLSWDGQLVDDARLVTALARTAAAAGARILTRVRALALAGDGAQVRDELTGQEFAIRARSVINATGVWAGDLVDDVRLRPSRGTHLVVRAERLDGLSTGLHIPVPGELNRFVLVLPQGDGRVYIGLTDEPADGPIPDVPVPTKAEVGFLLDVVSSALDTPLDQDDIVGAYAGLRPLLETGSSQSARTADISRRHAVLTSRDGVVTIVGGKLTTYRCMAQDAVDTVVARHDLTASPCRTKRLPLIGAATPQQLARLDAPRRLIQRYGTEAPAVAALADNDPSLLEPVVPTLPALGVELAWAVRHEGALDASDLLDRRTRIGLVQADREAALPLAESLLG